MKLLKEDYGQSPELDTFVFQTRHRFNHYYKVVLTNPFDRPQVEERFFAFLSNSKLTIACNQCETATTLNSHSLLMNFCSKQCSPISSHIPIKANFPIFLHRIALTQDKECLGVVVLL